jgi:hypothetical protein
MQTTIGNLQSHMNGIPFATLSTSFQDAFQVVSDLGGKVVASRRQNRARQLEDTLAGRIYTYIEMTDEEIGFLDLTHTKVRQVARQVDLGFLWIDALCIIQDDKQDWEEQCPRMENVYKNALVTIVPTDAENSWQIKGTEICIHLRFYLRPGRFLVHNPRSFVAPVPSIPKNRRTPFFRRQFFRHL